MSRSSASFSESFKVFSSLSEASAAFPNVNRLVPIIHYYPYGQTAEPAAIPLKNSKLMFPVQPAGNGMLWYSPFFDEPPSCQSISESCSSSVACCGCMELSPDCDNCSSCPIDYSDPQFPYFTNCTGDQIQQIGPTYICVDKNVICTGDLFTVTFNVINISGGQWDWIPPDAAPPQTGPDAYAVLYIYAPGESPAQETTCLEIEYVTSSNTPFAVYPAFDPSNANGLATRGANIITVGWPLSIANNAEQVITVTFKMTGCCTCDLEPLTQHGIFFTAEVVRGCNCSTCYRCKPCDSPFNVVAVPNWRSNVTTCPPESCVSIGGEWKSPFFDVPPSCESSDDSGGVNNCVGGVTVSTLQTGYQSGGNLWDITSSSYNMSTGAWSVTAVANFNAGGPPGSATATCAVGTNAAANPAVTSCTGTGPYSEGQTITVSGTSTPPTSGNCAAWAIQAVTFNITNLTFNFSCSIC
jgi:hypothetical protein